MNLILPKGSFTHEANQLTDHFHSLHLDSAPEVEPSILAPFWSVGDFINFSGPAGSGKTRIAADIVIAACFPHREGSSLGGLLKFDLEKLGGRKIAIIDAENDRYRWASILRQKLRREGISDFNGQERIVHIRASEIGIQQAANWAQVSDSLATALAWNRVGFVIGDTLARIWAPDEINSPAWVQQGFAVFRDTCRKFEVSGLMLTHTKRRGNSNDPAPEGPIGSSFQESQADGQIMISPTRTGASGGVKLTHRKSRRSFWIAQGSSVTLRFTRELGYEGTGDWQKTWPYECPNLDDFEPASTPDTPAGVEQLLAKAPCEGLTSKAIADDLGVDHRTVNRHLNRLEQDGRAERTGGGPSTRWRSR